MKNSHFELASHLVAEIEVFGNLAIAKFGIRTDWLFGMQHTGIPFVPTYWAGRGNDRKKLRLVRTTKQLADIGRLHRVTKSRSNRTSHVVPTSKLLADAVGRLDAEVSREDFFEGLERTEWGRNLIQSIRSHLNASDVTTN